MIGEEHALTRGYVQRHIPPGSGLGLDVAIIDIAQDFLLAHLERSGVFDELAVFKGGTALRKLFAGSQGRFSTDLDLAALQPGADRTAVADLIGEVARSTLGPFRFDPEKTRGRWQIRVCSDFGDPHIAIKLDVGPPCWLKPERRAFVQAPVQRRYGFNLPELPCARLEEIMAEKIARLARRATARDASDLVWIATTSPYSGFPAEKVRLLAVLKTWVDNHGLRPDWPTAIAPEPFDPTRWLSPRAEWDDEQIGLLTGPAPTLVQLEADLRRFYGWLGDLTPLEGRVACVDAADRGEVIRLVKALPTGSLGDIHLW